MVLARAIPTATDAGNYTVYYKVVGDDNYNDVEAATVEPFITKIDATGTAPKAVKLPYNGKAQELVEAGETNDGRMQYSLDGESYADAIPTATNVGTYMVYYKVAGDKNHNDAELGNVKSEIVKSDPAVTAPTATTGPFIRMGCRPADESRSTKSSATLFRAAPLRSTWSSSATRRKRTGSGNRKPSGRKETPRYRSPITLCFLARASKLPHSFSVGTWERRAGSPWSPARISSKKVSSNGERVFSTMDVFFGWVGED